VRRVADDGQHQIVMGGIHLVDIRAHRRPAERAQRGPPPRGRSSGSGVSSHQRLRTAWQSPTRARNIPCPQGDGRGRNARLRQMRRHRRDHRLLDRTHVGHRRARPQMRADLGGNLAHRAHRHAQHHKVGALRPPRRPSRSPGRRTAQRHGPRLGRSWRSPRSRPPAPPRASHAPWTRRSAPDRSAQPGLVDHFTPLNCADRMGHLPARRPHHPTVIRRQCGSL
jgi:hypothetical protein